MAESLGYLFAQTFRSVSGYTCTTTDSRGGPTNRSIAAGYYRVRLAAAAGTGAATDPTELLAALETALGAAYWRVRLQTSGLVRVTYLGSGNGTLTLPAELAAILGHGNIVGPLAANGGYTDGTYLPTHCVFAAACDPDSGWIDDPARFAGATLPSGVVYGWHDGRNLLRRRASFAALPKTWAFRTSLGASGTPAFPVSSRVQSPITSEPAQAPPWSALDTHATAAGVQCAITWGDLAAIIGGTVTEYDVVYLAPEHHTAGARVSLWREGYDARRSWALDLLFAGAGAL